MIFTPKSGVKKLIAMLYYGFLTRTVGVKNLEQKNKTTNINAV